MRGHPDFDFLLRRQQQLRDSGHIDAWALGTTRVLIAQSSRLLAEALMLAIDAEPSLEPVGYALDGWEALELTESLDPDVLVVGSSLEGIDSVTLTRLLTDFWPEVRVVVLTEASAADRADEARAAGAAGCLALDRSADELIEAITAVTVRPLRFADEGIRVPVEVSYV